MERLFKMKNLTFPKYRTFIYGLCVDQTVPEMVAQAEEDGCMFVQLIPYTIPAQKPTIHLGSAYADPIPAYKLLVRLPEAAYPALVEKVKARQQAIQVAPNGSVPGVH
jgi:hypothetical protein